MQISKREFLKKLGLLGATGVAGAVLGDEYVATNKTLPPGSVGDPDNVWFGQRIFPINHTIEDGPSCRLEGGRIVMPAREVPLSMRRMLLLSEAVLPDSPRRFLPQEQA